MAEVDKIDDLDTLKEIKETIKTAQNISERKGDKEKGTDLFSIFYLRSR
jgi:phosphosulfolactate phosphohydrolase-like enzyme